MAKEKFSVDELAAIFAEDDEEARQVAIQVREDLSERDFNSPARGEEGTESK